MATVKRDADGARIGRLDSAYRADGTPKYIRIYRDPSGETDCITIVFAQIRDGFCHYVGMTDGGTIWAHGDSRETIDRPSYRHLGKKIAFQDLDVDAQASVLREYAYLWGK